MDSQLLCSDLLSLVTVLSRVNNYYMYVFMFQNMGKSQIHKSSVLKLSVLTCAPNQISIPVVKILSYSYHGVSDMDSVHYSTCQHGRYNRVHTRL